MSEWTTDQDRLLLKLVAQQLSWPEIGERMGRTDTSCRNRFARYLGPKPKPRGLRTVPDLSPEQAAEARRLRASGRDGRMDVRKIAKALGVSEIAVERAISPDRLRWRHKRNDERRIARVEKQFARVCGITVPDRVLDERNRAYAAPMSITAALFGDPPAGRSALDRRAQWS